MSAVTLNLSTTGSYAYSLYNNLIKLISNDLFLTIKGANAQRHPPPFGPLQRSADERALGTITDILNKMFESPPPLLKVLCKPNYGLEI